jgi:hypothetical protein
MVFCLRGSGSLSESGGTYQRISNGIGQREVAEQVVGGPRAVRDGGDEDAGGVVGRHPVVTATQFNRDFSRVSIEFSQVSCRVATGTYGDISPIMLFTSRVATAPAAWQCSVLVEKKQPPRTTCYHPD